jgi:SAM-dependent methyltransferase
MTTPRKILGGIRRFLGARQAPSLDPRLSQMEAIFKAPPLTRELVAAIRLISPHCDLSPGNPRHREIWQADQNGTCWGEYEALGPILDSLEEPRNILEIGPGMGRSVIFLAKKRGWPGSRFSVYEGNGTTTRYTSNGPRFPDSFCGNVDALRAVLKFNAIEGVEIYDASKLALGDLPVKFDLIYSFYCIGFHWALREFLPDIIALMGNGATAIFTVTDDFQDFDAIKAFDHSFVGWKTAWPSGGQLRFLVMKKRGP